MQGRIEDRFIRYENRKGIIINHFIFVDIVVATSIILKPYRSYQNMDIM